jgi:putative ABC transport system permease protein
MTGFTPLLRLAWRDIWRNKGRSTVVFLMILLPVLGVSAASTVIATAGISDAERVTGDLGTASMTLAFNQDEGTKVSPAEAAPTMESDVRAALGSATETVLRVDGPIRVTTDKGATRVDAYESELSDPLLVGTYRLVEGRLPRSTDEVVVNGYLAGRGPGLGEKLVVRDGPERTVVGIVEDPFYKQPARAWGLHGSLIGNPDAAGAITNAVVFARTPGSLDMRKVASLGAKGYFPTTREQDAANYHDNWGLDGADFAVFVLVVVMALTEVALLAGPAFAVSARRRQRELALVSANGGTPRQVRAAVMATAFVIGGLAAVLGAAGGVVAGWLAAPVVERFQSSWFGDRAWSPSQVAGVALFGLVSAVLAALVPSWIASRQDVVRVLTGRRGDPAPMRFSPLLGIVLMVVGAGLTFIGVAATGSSYGEIWIGFGAVATVLGAVALMPLILRIVARLAGGTPLPVRYALRDGLRHRTRTVPAIGAVMATVAGVVALGIANSSQAAAGEKSYQPELPMGTAVVRLWSDNSFGDVPRQWVAVEPVVKRLAPDAVFLRGMVDEGGQSVSVNAGGKDLFGDFYGPVNNGIVVASSVPSLPFGLSAAERAQADAVLARGGAVVIGDRPTRVSQVTLVRSASDPDDPEGNLVPSGKVTVPAAAFVVKGRPLATSIVSERAAQRLGADVAIAGALINRQVSPTEAKTLEEAVLDVADGGEVYVERGWQPDSEYAIIMLVLMVVGALLMVGGTVTATVLALADAAPDLATLSAVGAAPRTSRAVAMGIAFVIGGIGAALGVVVGAVPGLAATWPMTAHNAYYGNGYNGPGGHTVDVPWLLLAEIAVGVPVLLALVVGLCARSRLPLVARVD